MTGRASISSRPQESLPEARMPVGVHDHAFSRGILSVLAQHARDGAVDRGLCRIPIAAMILLGRTGPVFALGPTSGN